MAEVDDAPLATAKDRDEAQGAPGVELGDQVNIRAVTINRPARELFAYWRDFANLSTFMENVERIDVLDARRSRWVVKGPGGTRYEWDALVTDEVDGKSIDWRSDEGADVVNSGRVEFADAGARGTVVTATIAYDPPAGFFGKVVAKVMQREPALQSRRDLRRFKQLMETGEIAVAANTRAKRDEERN